MIRVESTQKGPTGNVEIITLNAGYYEITCAGAKGGAGNGDKSIPSCIGGFGATLSGTFTLQETSQLIILPGNPGTDNEQTSGNGTTGAGGGGTYVALVVDSNYQGALLTSGFTNVECNNKYVIPLMVAAGGNGGRDYGYVGDGAVYHGVHTTYASFVSGTNQGGSFENYTSAATTKGTNFINGGHAATYSYTRSSKTSTAGFGGGGSNRDDNEGGGGGGYYGGHITLSACSYWNNDYISNFTGETGNNDSFGYVEIESIIPPGPFSLQGDFIIDLPVLNNYNDLEYVIINDNRVIWDNTTIRSYISESEGVWHQFEPNNHITLVNKNNVRLKYALTTMDEMITPLVNNIELTCVLKIDNKQIIIKLDKLSKFNNAEGEVTVTYNNAVGALVGNDDAEVEGFTASFTPINVVKKINPSIKEYVNNSMRSAVEYRHIGTVSSSINSDIVHNSIKNIVVEIKKINNVNP